MQFNLLPLVVLLALVSSVHRTVNGTPVEDKPTTASQIERPPQAEGEEDDDTPDLQLYEDFDYSEGNSTVGEDGDEDEDEDGEEDEEAGEHVGGAQGDFDVDYEVMRPTTAPRKKTWDRECEPEDYLDYTDGDLQCKRANKVKKNLKPYTNYKGYKTWERRPLFIIIIGGLRWDYLTESKWNLSSKPVEGMKAFSWMKKHGTTLSQVVPVFPPYDLPTWTSLATGLYPKTTGVTGDYMYNLKTKKLFKRDDSLENWWVKGEPIWSIAAKNGRKVSVLNWHDCALPGRNIEDPVDCKPFSTSTPTPTKQKLIQLFNQAFTKIHSSNYDLSIVYTDAVKKAALRHGPNSPEVLSTLIDLDDVLQGRLSDIKNKKERANLKCNFLLLSDYGLSSRENTTKIVLDEYVEFDHVQYIIQRGGSIVIVPYALKAGDIMQGVGNKLGIGAMHGIYAYLRDVNLEVPPLEYPPIPDELNYAGYTWTQDILLLAKPGFEIEILNGSSKLFPPFKTREEELGTSGYHPNPPQPHIVPGRDKHKSKELRAREKIEGDLYTRFAHMMKTIGFAWGPDFKPGFVSDPIELVDLYQIMTFLLDVDPNNHDGEWDRVKKMLVLSGAEEMIPSFLSISLSLCLYRFI